MRQTGAGVHRFRKVKAGTNAAHMHPAVTLEMVLHKRLRAHPTAVQPRFRQLPMLVIKRKLAQLGALAQLARDVAVVADALHVGLPRQQPHIADIQIGQRDAAFVIGQCDGVGTAHRNVDQPEKAMPIARGILPHLPVGHRYADVHIAHCVGGKADTAQLGIALQHHAGRQSIYDFHKHSLLK